MSGKTRDSGVCSFQNIESECVNEVRLDSKHAKDNLSLSLSYIIFNRLPLRLLIDLKSGSLYATLI